MKAKADFCLKTLQAQSEHPIIMACSRAITALAPRAHELDSVFLQIFLEMKLLQEWRGDDVAALDGQIQKDAQSLIGAFLGLNASTDDDILISHAPIARQAHVEPMNALGEKDERAAAARANHLPNRAAPRICALNQEVAAKA